MTATVNPTTTSTAPGAGAGSTKTRSLWRTGAGAGLAAAAATVAIAGTASAAGVSLETAPGQAIPVLGFGQLTLFFTAIGVLIATSIRRRAGRPRTTLVKVTAGLTALSLVPDLMISAGATTKITFILTHLVAAAIVVPALAARLPEQRTS
jgi:peptidoglycan/LPS O-acetylase OafA/YrhL